MEWNKLQQQASFLAALPVQAGAAFAESRVARIMAGNVIFPLALRTAFSRSDRKRDEGLSVPEDISRILDVPYGQEDPQQVFDVYRPLDVPQEEILPAIISIHGGGYVYGDKELYQYYCMDLARRGFAVVNFSYRLAPKNKYPAQLLDVAGCVRYVVLHAAEYGIDPKKVFFVGDSAGAQLLSQYAAAFANRKYAAMLNLIIPKELEIRAIALNCGMYTFDQSNQILKSYLPKKVSAYGEELQVTEHITGDYPPVYVMSAYGDFLLEHAAPMSRFLDGKGVENELHIYGSEDHPLGHVFHLNIRLPEAKSCNDDECAFFKRHL